VIIPECQDCGACCSFGSQYVPVTHADLDRLGCIGLAEVADPAQFEGYPFLPPYTMKARCLPDGRCVALAGRVGVAVSCSIYEKRPEACRKFERGSVDCAYFLGWHRLGRPW
jgi:Fe-S-cluster containining protein